MPDGQTVNLVRKKGVLLFSEHFLDGFLLACASHLGRRHPASGFRASTIVDTLCLIMES